MIDRICISINNRCNLACSYCHFHEKGEIEAAEMDVYEILDHVKEYVGKGYAGKGYAEEGYAGKGYAEEGYAGMGYAEEEYTGKQFKIGFVGNGECFLDWQKLKSYIAYLEDAPGISLYTITNGTVRLPEEDLAFLEEHRVNVGFSIDGYKELHDRYRCNSFDRAMENVERYRQVTGHYPTFNATVGKESLRNAEKVISFFRPFGTKVTFSRMIGKYGISLGEYRDFISMAEKEILVRRNCSGSVSGTGRPGQVWQPGMPEVKAGPDCTMYGGLCGAGKNNYFFANGKIYYCGNCIDLPPVGDSGMSLRELEKISLTFDRNYCYKESL